MLEGWKDLGSILALLCAAGDLTNHPILLNTLAINTANLCEKQNIMSLRKAIIPEDTAPSWPPGVLLMMLLGALPWPCCRISPALGVLGLHPLDSPPGTSPQAHACRQPGASKLSPDGLVETL